LRVPLESQYDFYSTLSDIARKAVHARTLSFHRVAHTAVIRVYDKAGNLIETLEHVGDFKER